MKIKNMEVAVTGGAGFIGSHLVDRLVASGNKVIVIDNFLTGERKNLESHLNGSNVKIIGADVRDRDRMMACLKGVPVVFHLATHCVRLSLSEPEINHEVNATGTLNTLLAARAGGCRLFVYCSSSEVYGNAMQSTESNGQVKLREDDLAIPTTIYGASKLVGEHYALAFHRTYGLDVTVVRPFNTYGPRSHVLGAYGEVIPRFATLLTAGKPAVIFGDGTQTRDYTYVEDTARCLVEAAERDELVGETVNIAAGREASVKEIAEVIARQRGVPCSVRHVEPRAGDIQFLGADTAKARKAGLLTHMIPLEEGMSRYLCWLDDQGTDYAGVASQLEDRNWKKAG